MKRSASCSCTCLIESNTEHHLSESIRTILTPFQIESSILVHHQLLHQEFSPQTKFFEKPSSYSPSAHGNVENANGQLNSLLYTRQDPTNHEPSYQVVGTDEGQLASTKPTRVHKDISPLMKYQGIHFQFIHVLRLSIWLDLISVMSMGGFRIRVDVSTLHQMT